MKKLKVLNNACNFLPLSLFLFLILSISFIFTNATDDIRTRSFTVNVAKHNLDRLKQWQKSEILKGGKITGEFIAEEDNLGILAFRFYNELGRNTEIVAFRLKEKSKDTWYYDNKYHADQFLPDELFTFGFPPIPDSSGKTYIFEIESLNGKPGNAVSVSAFNPVFETKYKYSKQVLLSRPDKLLTYLLKKFSRYISLRDIFVIFFLSFMPYYLNSIFKKSGRLATHIYQYIQFRSKNRIFQYIPPLIIFLSTFIAAGIFSFFLVDPHHDGIMLKPALDIASGQVLFRDTFTQYGALTTLIQAGAIRIFGEYLIVIRLITALFFALSSAALWFVWGKIMPSALSTLSGLLLILIGTYMIWIVMPWSSVYAIFFQALSLYFFLTFIEKKRNASRHLFLSGVSVAFTFWCRQPVGVFLLLAYFIYFAVQLIKDKCRYFRSHIINLLVFASGGILTCLLFFIWLILNGAFRDWWLQSIKLAYVFGLERGAGFAYESIINDLFPLKMDYLWVLLPVICLVCLVWLMFRILRNKKMDIRDGKLLIALLVSLASWMQYYPVVCELHVYWSVYPMVGVVVYFIYKTSETIYGLYMRVTDQGENKVTGGYARILIFLSILYCIFMPVVRGRITRGIARLNGNYVTLTGPSVLRWMRVSPTDKVYFEGINNQLKEYLNKHPHAPVITTGADALWLTFVPQYNNFHPMYVDWDKITDSIYPDYRDKLSLYINEFKPIIVATSIDLFEGYCQAGISTDVRDMSVKYPYEGTNDFSIADADFSGHIAINIKASKGLDKINDIVVEEKDKEEKIRLWRMRENEYCGRMIVTGSGWQGDRINILISDTVKYKPQVRVKILFEGDQCYIEKEVRV